RSAPRKKLAVKASAVCGPEPGSTACQVRPPSALRATWPRRILLALQEGHAAGVNDHTTPAGVAYNWLPTEPPPTPGKAPGPPPTASPPPRPPPERPRANSNRAPTAQAAATAPRHEHPRATGRRQTDSLPPTGLQPEVRTARSKAPVTVLAMPPAHARSPATSPPSSRPARGAVTMPATPWTILAALTHRTLPLPAPRPTFHLSQASRPDQALMPAPVRRAGSHESCLRTAAAPAADLNSRHTSSARTRARRAIRSIARSRHDAARRAAPTRATYSPHLVNGYRGQDVHRLAGVGETRPLTPVGQQGSGSVATTTPSCRASATPPRRGTSVDGRSLRSVRRDCRSPAWSSVSRRRSRRVAVRNSRRPASAQVTSLDEVGLGCDGVAAAVRCG